MKKAPLHPILCGREFGAAAVHVPSLLSWVASKGLYLRTEPSIGDYEIMQVEALLCDIERGARPDNYDEADALVSRTPELAEHSNDPCSVWLVGAEAHRKWRDLLREAFNAGELKLLDYASLLPLKADEAHAPTLPTAEPMATQTKEAKKPGRPRSSAPKQLEKILVALESYAAETGQHFDRWAMPGPMGDGYSHEGSFHWLCATVYPSHFLRSKSIFEGYRNGVCTSVRRTEATDFYREALPHIASILGVKPNVRKRSNWAAKAA